MRRIIAILVLILELENATRLIAQVDRLDRPFAMLSTLCGLLAPEYVAMALPFALFLATALAFRQFAMRSELAAMLAAGVSRRRLIRGPLLLGILCAAALLALRGYVQPICEAQLAARGDQIRAGLFGLGLTVGELSHVSPDTALLVGGAGPRAGELSDIFVDSPTGTFSAPRANAVFGADGALALTMFDGRAVEHGAVQRGRAAFRRLTVRIPLAIPPARRLTPDQRLEFLTQSELLTLAPQALALLNNDFVHEQSRALAERVEREAGGDEREQIERAWWLALCRAPSESERAAAVSHLDLQRRNLGEDEARRQALTSLCHVLLNLNEFIYVD